MGADDASRARAYAYAAGVAVGAFVVVACARRGRDDDDSFGRFGRVVEAAWSRASAAVSDARRASVSESMSRSASSASGTRWATREEEVEDVDDDALRERFEGCARRFAGAAEARYVDPKVKARLYGLYKRSTKDFERDATRPTNPLDGVAWIKYEAWAKARALSRGEAMRAYVEMFTNWERERDRAKTVVDDDGFTEADRLAAVEFHTEEEEETSTVNDGERGVYGGAWSQMEKRQSQPVVEDHSAWSDEEETTTSGALIEACKLGDLDAAMAAIQNGADVNERDAFGRTPMHWCADGGHSKLAMNLAVLKAEINVQDKYGQTPLHFAVNLDDVDMTNTLLDWGADPNIADDDGETPESLGIWGIVSDEEEEDDDEEEEEEEEE